MRRRGMKSNMRAWAVPLGSFLLAGILSMLAGPSMRALGFRAPMATSSKCSCQLKVLRMNSQVDWSSVKVRGETQALVSKVTVSVHADICQERPATEPANAITTQAFAKFWVEVALINPNTKVPSSIEGSFEIELPSAQAGTLTCPGSNISYDWKADLAALETSVFPTIQKIINKRGLQGDTVLNVSLFFEPGGVPYTVKTSALCAGKTMTGTCNSTVPLTTGKGQTSGSDTNSNQCSVLTCSFGSP
jgi:hypothetical protein